MPNAQAEFPAKRRVKIVIRVVEFHTITCDVLEAELEYHTKVGDVSSWLEDVAHDSVQDDVSISTEDYDIYNWEEVS